VPEINADAARKSEKKLVRIRVRVRVTVREPYP